MAQTLTEAAVRGAVKALNRAADCLFIANQRAIKMKEPTPREADRWKGLTCGTIETIERLVRDLKVELLGEEET